MKAKISTSASGATNPASIRSVVGNAANTPGWTSQAYQAGIFCACWTAVGVTVTTPVACAI
jgi:hypothetical protein